MHYVIALLGPGRTGLTQIFGPYETLLDAQAALAEVEQWRGLRGQWEIRRLTHYKTGDAPNPIPTPTWPQGAGVAQGVWLTGVNTCAPIHPPQTCFHTTGSPATYNITINTLQQSPEAAAHTPESETVSSLPRREHRDAHLFRIHAPADLREPNQPPHEVLADQHVVDGEFVEFRDNADLPVLTVRIDHVARIERLRADTVIPVTVAEIDLIRTALVEHAIRVEDRETAQHIYEYAQSLGPLREHAAARAETDGHLPRP